MKSTVLISALVSYIAWAPNADATSSQSKFHECSLEAAHDVKVQAGAQALRSDSETSILNTPTPPPPSKGADDCWRQEIIHYSTGGAEFKYKFNAGQIVSIKARDVFIMSANFDEKQAQEIKLLWAEISKPCAPDGRLRIVTLCTVGSSPEKLIWRKFTENDRLISYVEARQAKSAVNVIVWVLYDYKTEQHSPKSDRRYYSQKTQQEVDCDGERSRTLFFTWHSGRMGAGKVIYTGHKEFPWEPNSPDSIATALAAQVCGTRS